MQKCAICNGELEEYKEKKDGIEIRGWKCNKCGEIFFSANELLRWEVLSGRRKDNVRKIRRIGNSLTVTLPNFFVKTDDIHDNDLAVFKKNKKKGNFSIQIIHT